jgi:uncharacterized membrane protein
MFILYFVVAAGLLMISKSWLMSLGIFLLIILIDRMIVVYENKRRLTDNADDNTKE